MSPYWSSSWRDGPALLPRFFGFCGSHLSHQAATPQNGWLWNRQAIFLYSCTWYVSSLYFSAYQYMSVLLCLPDAMINIDQSPSRGAESLFGLKVTVHPSSREAEQEVKAGTWKYKLKEKWGTMPLGLLPLTCTDSFLIYPVTICPGWKQSTVRWTLFTSISCQENVSTDVPTEDSNRISSSVEVPSLQVTRFTSSWQKLTSTVPLLYCEM